MGGLKNFYSKLDKMNAASNAEQCVEYNPQSVIAPPESADTSDTGRSNYLAAVRQLEDALRVRLLSFEYEIILALYDAIKMPLKQLMLTSKASPAKFYLAIRELSEREIIQREIDENDKRKKIYRINNEIRNHIDNEHYNLKLNIISKSNSSLYNISNITNSIENCLKVKCSSNNGEIIFSLYEKGPWTALDGANLSTMSTTTFFSTLKFLEGLELIEGHRDPDDNRRRIYQLKEYTAHIIARHFAYE